MTLIESYDRDRRRVVRFRALVVAALGAGAGVWLTVPYGIVLIVGGVAAGWWLIAAGVVLLAACIAAGIGAARSRTVHVPVEGKPHPAFDIVKPSPNPDPGVAWVDAKLGSQ
jgi:hypothetical protein